MSKATVDALGELHGAVAKELTRRINADEASAADIGAAIKFLKDNQITASIEDNSQLQDLQQKLKERAEKRGLKLVQNKTAELSDAEADDIIAKAAQAA
ncbi:hypothetical protein CAL26_21070 [Bordetella genomosp. 9]|uniref:Terminase small subunit n=1 Tax=Bordetella genomosp. 9 TaxID=1416803 RepID=A0A261R4U9_9BORD|nr:hypothetical protein [Bordetella genomosp. 9]OZI20048.1 hypothetical protein CAL26_21070 [Bordetella genomosp. 9]